MAAKNTILKMLFKPALRLALRHSIKIQEIIELLKVSFSEVAIEEMGKQGLNYSASRLSAMTGLQRREISRITEKKPPATQSVNLITRIIGQWEQDKRFCTKAGKAKILSFDSKQSEFVDFVKTISSDLNPYTICFELERLGLVKRTSKGIKLCTNMNLITEDLTQGFAILANDIEDLTVAVEENLTKQRETRNLHLRTEYDNLAVEHLPKIKLWLIEQGSLFHERARKFISQFDKDINPSLKQSKGGARIVLGAFSRADSLDVG